MSEPKEATINITPADANRLRQWFNAVEDLAPEYLENEDAELLAKLGYTTRHTYPPAPKT